MVGLIVPDLVHAFFSEVAKSISTVIRKGGYGLVISSSEDDPRLEQEELLRMMRHRVRRAGCCLLPRDIEAFAEDWCGGSAYTAGSQV
jgi:DNA-binding LacI/PurR family transcriptional regulator